MKLKSRNISPKSYVLIDILKLSKCAYDFTYSVPLIILQCYLIECI